MDIKKIRAEFPILGEKVHGRPLAYLDNAATTQKPRRVIDKISECYSRYNANIHRGVHYLADKLTGDYEAVREQVRQFVNAGSTREVVFTRGATESVNLVSCAWGEQNVQAGDEVLITQMEHHSNLVPWQLLCQRKKAKLKAIPINEKGELVLDGLDSLLSERTRIVALTQVSNTLGTINPVKTVIDKAHARGIPVLVDGAQAVQHMPVDVQALDCDFYAFSGHKMYGPTGIGVLYGKEKLLEAMPPFHGGGEMIKTVSLEKSTYNELPYKFEAGTPNFIDTIALGEAISFIDGCGLQNIAAHEDKLLRYAEEKLSTIEGMRIYGQAAMKTSALSFLIGNIHAYDTGMILDKLGIAVRTGTHCTEPLMHYYGIKGTVRASLAVYNTMEEIDRLHEALLQARDMLS